VRNVVPPRRVARSVSTPSDFGRVVEVLEPSNVKPANPDVSNVNPIEKIAPNVLPAITYSMDIATKIEQAVSNKLMRESA